VVGDFNSVPGSKAELAMHANWDNTSTLNTLTYPADNPNIKIDHVFIPKNTYQVSKESVVDESVASDHRPIFVDLMTK
jgi:endonuclease/exonuclease/phosphatase (EEP) superfamily protein YafD